MVQSALERLGSVLTCSKRSPAHLPEHAIAELITIVDKDNDGEIDYLEFAKQCTDPGSGRAKQVRALRAVGSHLIDQQLTLTRSKPWSRLAPCVMRGQWLTRTI